PWARTMVVTDRIAALLTPAELRAVLAHEAGHLSEGPWVIGARLGTAILLLFVLTTGLRVGGALHPDGATIALIGGVLIAIPALIAVRRLARRMEERADARARSTAGSASLADALSKIHVDARMPMVTGAKRVHPDLYDRLVACGRDPGPRPKPPKRRAGMIAGLVLGGVLVLALVLTERITRIEIADAPLAGESAARWRLRVDPWDSHAMMAWAWATRRRDDLELADAQLARAMRMGAPMPEVMELEAELMATRGDCEGARVRFEDALSARAQRAFAEPWAPLELGGWHLPPTLVTECGYGSTTPEP
ncbi:MAG: M48 family metalloprotease, partial [Myxococcota bacterium]|nr:M48 family metalloprotease [Myxococcota bacterium]